MHRLASRQLTLRRLTASVHREVLLQARYSLYLVSVVVVAVFGGAIALLPAGALGDPAPWVPPLIFFNLLLTTFYFTGALVLLERDEGVLAPLVVTPLTAVEYLAARLLTLTALALAENLALVALLFGWRLDWPLLVAGTAGMAAIYLFAGFLSVVRYRSINRWLLPSIGVVMASMLPIVELFGLLDRMLGAGPAAHWLGEALRSLHPAGPPLELLAAGAGGDLSAGRIAYSLAATAAWIAAGLHWGRRAFERFVVRQAGG